MQRIRELEQDCVALDSEIIKLDDSYDDIVQRETENLEREKREHAELAKSLKTQNANYKNRLWELLYNIRN